MEWRPARSSWIASAVALAACGQAAVAQSEHFALSKQVVLTGLARPVSLASPPGDAARLFVCEQFSGTTGRVRIVDLTNGTLVPTPFLSITGVSTGNEQGLLGLCFHPQYAQNGYAYVYYVKDGATWLDRFTVSGTDPNQADPASRKTIWSVTRPAAHHNCGWIEFGPDGYLYVGVGDGAQTLATIDQPESPFGRMLRLDVDGGDPYAIPADNPWVGVTGLDEAWVTGLRNPWRCAFDPVDGELWIADVGNAAREEIDVMGTGAGGLHFGWPCWEGNIPYLTLGSCPPAGTLTYPIHEYVHTGGACSITGGRVYRGDGSTSLRGTYFFADLCNNKIWTLHRGATGGPQVIDRTAQVQASWNVTCFGEDGAGNLYYASLPGSLVRITAADVGCTSDFDQDGDVDATDLAALLGRWGALGATTFDTDRSDEVDGGDLANLISSWGPCT